MCKLNFKAYTTMQKMQTKMLIKYNTWNKDR